MYTFAQLFPALTANEPAVLACDRNASHQAPHTDISDLSVHASTFDANPPLSVLLALQGGTTLKVWPRSHVTVWRFVNDPSASICAEQVFKSMKLQLHEGEVVIFRGDLVHAGDDYMPLLACMCVHAQHCR